LELENFWKGLLFEKQNENVEISLQKNEESTKEHKSKSQVANMNFQIVVCSPMHCCQMSKAAVGHVDFLIQIKLI
jgi:hypothetical protein